ncbi:MAG: prepilin-type N-terminal cleavage/methylation domain-containing protein [Gemmatimonadota bacterium]|nr:prepilin-type N-terminal cleavage/methylation domain-containing protein [Gemmatimonadota bacterium]
MIIPLNAAPHRARSVKSRERRGFTLLEVMVSVTMLLLVFAMAFPVFRTQLRAMGSSAGRSDAQQNVRFAISTIDRQLRVAGAGVADAQPLIVQADPYAITFNADYASRDTAAEGGAFGAVYFDPDLPVGSTMSMVPTTQVTLPISSVSWPAIAYFRTNGPPSSAETISFWVAPDASAGSNGRYALFRRVNAMPIDTLARGIVFDPVTPPFTYQTINTAGAAVDVPVASLPAYHVAVHGSPADTGSSNLTDQIRFVKVHLIGSFIERDGTTTQRPADTSVRLLNAGLLNHATCGDPPVFGQTVSAAASPGAVLISFRRAVDESGGERDVEKYVIYRRLPAAAFADPLVSIPAGQNNYTFTDTQVSSGSQWVYGVVAEDCGGQFSPMASTVQVTVP